MPARTSKRSNVSESMQKLLEAFGNDVTEKPSNPVNVSRSYVDEFGERRFKYVNLKEMESNDSVFINDFSNETLLETVKNIAEAKGLGLNFREEYEDGSVRLWAYEKVSIPESPKRKRRINLEDDLPF